MPEHRAEFTVGRPAYFANRVLRLAIKTALAQETGPDSFALLTVIAMTEDARRYRGPVTFWNSQLLPLVGFSKWERLDRGRRKLIEAGWLLYEPGGRHRPGLYRVTVPAKLASVADAAVDEGSIPSEGYREDESLGKLDVVDPPVSILESDTEPESKRVSTGASTGGSSLPVPVPTPEPEPKKSAAAAGSDATAQTKNRDRQEVKFPDELDGRHARTAFSEWLEHRKQLRKPLKPLAQDKLLKQWSGKGAERFVAAVDHSIANGWQGLFEPDNRDSRAQSTSQAGLMDSLHRFVAQGGDK